MTIKDDRTNKVFGAAKSQVERALMNAALLVERDAKELVPVDTGTLKRSITHEVTASTAFVGSNIEYAPHVELGTKKTPARSFLRQALLNNKKAIAQLFKGI